MSQLEKLAGFMSGMNRKQRMAWAIVSSMSLAVVLGVGALVSHRLGPGWLTTVLVIAAVVVQGTGALMCFRIKPDKGGVTSDERDKLIEKNTNLAGFGAGQVQMRRPVRSVGPRGLAQERVGAVGQLHDRLAHTGVAAVDQGGAVGVGDPQREGLGGVVDQPGQHGQRAQPDRLPVRPHPDVEDVAEVVEFAAQR